MRGTLSLVSVLLLAGAILAGCEAETRPNDPRPPVVPVISVSVSEEGIEVAPRAIGLPGKPASNNLNQNDDAPVNPADLNAPSVVNFRVSNLLRRPAALVLEGPVDRAFAMTPSGPGQFSAGLKTGIYRLSSPASAGTTRLLVGPGRISSSSDLLTP